ncbi:MAG: biotin synthase BioB [Ruminiclostridium sp.]|nr:biotin synthase BioB [Ruminiclostridium sp.]
MHSYSEERPLTREEAVVLLQTPDEQLEALIEKAGVLRRKYKGNKVSVQLLTNVRSGNCSQDCAYCAQSCRSGADIEKYRSIPAEKLYADNSVVNEKHLARHCIGLSGISFTDGETAELADRIRAMKQTGTHICCSIGFLTEKQARMLRDAGLDRINHNLNTSRRYYPNICSTHTYEQRIENLRMLKRVGFEICCGGIIGMGESEEDAADMLLDIREISPQSVPINFLLPIKGTLLAEQHPPRLTTEYCLKVLCLARLMLPKADIRCAAGREVYFAGQEETLFGIVDSIFAAGYLTAGGQSIDDTLRLIASFGYEAAVESTGE